ncbi:MAG TPA: SDR family oxidoreductase [Terriglobia bacterium]|nr:SDR family oxidoreductase [Terriglobia bacterium]
MDENRGREWVLITGASSGIGRALAFEFASRGYNLFLTARNEAALRQVAEECGRKSKIETEIYLADLSNLGTVDELIRVLSTSGREFEILVNNAGFGVHGEFVKTELDQELGMLNVQLAALLKLTKALLPGMMARKSGRILNVASVYSFAPVPFQAVYSACKAFMLSFSAALREELKESGVAVTVLCPGTTQSEFRARAGITEKNKSAGVSAEVVARIAVRQTLRGRQLAVPGFSSRLFVFFARHLPFAVVPRVVRFVNNARGVNG